MQQTGETLTDEHTYASLDQFCCMFIKNTDQLCDLFPFIIKVIEIFNCTPHNVRMTLNAKHIH